ncbi:cytochrome P450 [Neolewinella aurantiaca]|uniref:Cytochrome P450 n=1 Tax=Neolewinella aurantiaca TaxID=2602767 RepID=A0A5C7FEH7_9BACT|nr:cytochrome P450 [Neolewinella aurantiaca]TXF87916.1 cytochrome P450 [Neolewinella aurantiaca]
MSSAKCPFSEFPDPFAAARAAEGIREIDDQGDPVKMVLGHRDVRKSAHDWRTFQSGAKPGRIVVPSEVNIRDIRQIPFETDPPEHTEYRALVEGWFRRPLTESYEAGLTNLINQELDRAISSGELEVVHDFALPLQSRALTLLLNCPLEEAEEWIGWGTHVFRSDDDPLDGDKANQLYDYLDAQIERASRDVENGEDIFAHLLRAEYRGRKLTHEEIKGVMILTFAGGRDTVINAVTNTLAYFAGHPEDLQKIREQPELSARAVEELVRYFAPLTHMGRVATSDAEVSGCPVAADSRISLCWASANRDPKVFEKPNEVDIERKANPHLSFGFGIHKCLGAPHARQVLKVLITALTQRVSSIQVTDHQDNIEQWGDFNRKVGFHRLQVKIS